MALPYPSSEQWLVVSDQWPVVSGQCIRLAGATVEERPFQGRVRLRKDCRL